MTASRGALWVENIFLSHHTVQRLETKFTWVQRRDSISPLALKTLFSMWHQWPKVFKSTWRELNYKVGLSSTSLLRPSCFEHRSQHHWDAETVLFHRIPRFDTFSIHVNTHVITALPCGLLFILRALPSSCLALVRYLNSEPSPSPSIPPHQLCDLFY